jgi:hypothetical protein
MFLSPPLQGRVALKPSPSRGGLGGMVFERAIRFINTIPTPALLLKGREQVKSFLNVPIE